MQFVRVAVNMDFNIFFEMFFAAIQTATVKAGETVVEMGAGENVQQPLLGRLATGNRGSGAATISLTLRPAAPCLL